MPLGSTKIIETAVMVNLVGEKGSKGPVIYKNFDQIIGLKVLIHIFTVNLKLDSTEKWVM